MKFPNHAEMLKILDKEFKKLPKKGLSSRWKWATPKMTFETPVLDTTILQVIMYRMVLDALKSKEVKKHRKPEYKAACIVGYLSGRFNIK